MEIPPTDRRADGRGIPYETFFYLSGEEYATNAGLSAALSVSFHPVIAVHNTPALTADHSSQSDIEVYIFFRSW
jgi:phosphopantothenate synthetase